MNYRLNLCVVLAGLLVDHRRCLPLWRCARRHGRITCPLDASATL